jgi:hypothetical protein
LLFNTSTWVDDDNSQGFSGDRDWLEEQSGELYTAFWNTDRRYLDRISGSFAVLVRMKDVRRRKVVEYLKLLQLLYYIQGERGFTILNSRKKVSVRTKVMMSFVDLIAVRARFWISQFQHPSSENIKVP